MVITEAGDDARVSQLLYVTSVMPDAGESQAELTASAPSPGVQPGDDGTLGVDPAAPHLNPHGGAIALGHPLGMSGARLTMTAAHGLEETGACRALVTMCIGVGQGLALAIERV